MFTIKKYISDNIRMLNDLAHEKSKLTNYAHLIYYGELKEYSNNLSIKADSYNCNIRLDFVYKSIEIVIGYCDGDEIDIILKNLDVNSIISVNAKFSLYKNDIIKLYDYIINNEKQIITDIINIFNQYSNTKRLIIENETVIQDYIYKLYVGQYGDVIDSELDKRNLSLFCLNFNNEYDNSSYIEECEKQEIMNALYEHVLKTNNNE
jgi:hypothetical protein